MENIMEIEEVIVYVKILENILIKIIKKIKDP